mgnify:CR=1 FL=1
MANVSGKTESNPFYQARYKASKHNDRLGARDRVAEMLLMDEGRLYRIEQGLADPHPDEIKLMADLYGAPHLINFYCNHCCPIGCHVPDVDEADLDRVTIQALSVLRNISGIKDDLLDITADGVIDENEKPVLEKIIRLLDDVSTVGAKLKNWMETNSERSDK